MPGINSRALSVNSFILILNRSFLRMVIRRINSVPEPILLFTLKRSPMEIVLVHEPGIGQFPCLHIFGYWMDRPDKNGRKYTAGGLPECQFTESLIRISIRDGSGLLIDKSTRPPSDVNFKALEIRLKNTFFHFIGIKMHGYDGS